MLAFEKVYISFTGGVKCINPRHLFVHRVFKHPPHTGEFLF